MKPFESPGTNLRNVLFLQRETERAELVVGRDCDWEEVIEAAKPHECVPVAATIPCTFSIPPAPPGFRKGSFAITAAICA